MRRHSRGAPPQACASNASVCHVPKRNAENGSNDLGSLEPFITGVLDKAEDAAGKQMVFAMPQDHREKMMLLSDAVVDIWRHFVPKG